MLVLHPAFHLLVDSHVWNLFSFKNSTLFTWPEGKTHKHTTEGKFKHYEKSNISEQISLQRQITYKPNSKKSTIGRYVFPPLTGKSVGYKAMLINIMYVWSRGENLFLCEAYHWLEILCSLGGYYKKFYLLGFYMV